MSVWSLSPTRIALRVRVPHLGVQSLMDVQRRSSLRAATKEGLSSVITAEDRFAITNDYCEFGLDFFTPHHTSVIVTLESHHTSKLFRTWPRTVSGPNSGPNSRNRIQTETEIASLGKGRYGPWKRAFLFVAKRRCQRVEFPSGRGTSGGSTPPCALQWSHLLGWCQRTRHRIIRADSWLSCA